jgi:hypothetical protein
MTGHTAQANPDADRPLYSLWTVVAWLTGAGIAAVIGLVLLRRIERGSKGR